MDRAESRLAPSPDMLRTSIPRPRRSFEQEPVLADDEMIELLRASQLDGDHRDPLLRMLVQWRQDVLHGQWPSRAC